MRAAAAATTTIPRRSRAWSAARSRRALTKRSAADPLRYVTAADPPMMILHGGSDPLVPHNQGEQLYMALNKACVDAVFISLPTAGHGPWNGFLTDDALREAATMRSTSGVGLRGDQPDAVTCRAGRR